MNTFSVIEEYISKCKFLLEKEEPTEQIMKMIESAERMLGIINNEEEYDSVESEQMVQEMNGVLKSSENFKENKKIIELENKVN